MPTDNFGFEHRQAIIRDSVSRICLRYMQRRNLSKQAFASQLQISASQLKNIVNKMSNTTLNVLIKISIITGEPILINDNHE